MKCPWACRASKMGRGEKREDGGKNLGPSLIGEGYTRIRGEWCSPSTWWRTTFPKIFWAPSFQHNSCLFVQNLLLEYIKIMTITALIARTIFVWTRLRVYSRLPNFSLRDDFLWGQRASTALCAQLHCVAIESQPTLSLSLLDNRCALSTQYPS